MKNNMIVTITGSGTSQGVPVIACECKVCLSENYKDKRLRSSIHIYYKGKSIVIDTGPDFRQQMLNLKVKSLDAVLFTHEHKDHVAGLDDVRAFNFSQKKPIDIYCNDQVFKALKREYHYIFDPKFQYPGFISLNTNIDQIGVIHDLNFEHYPEDLPKIVVNYYKKYMPLFAEKAKQIITVSNFSKKDIINKIGNFDENIFLEYEERDFQKRIFLLFGFQQV